MLEQDPAHNRDFCEEAPVDTLEGFNRETLVLFANQCRNT